MHGQIFMCSYVRYIFQNTFSHIMRATNVKNIWVGNIRFHVMISSFFLSVDVDTQHSLASLLFGYILYHPFCIQLEYQCNCFFVCLLSLRTTKVTRQGTKRKNGKERKRILKDYTTPDSSKNRLQNTLCLHCPNITHLCNLTDYKILILAREWVDNKGFGSPVHCLGKLIHNITVGAETLDRNTIGCTQGC